MQCVQTLLVVTTGEEGATGIYWVETRDEAKHPTMHRAGPHNKELASNVDRGWEALC